MREPGVIFLLAVIVVAVISLIKYWPPTYSHISPDDIVEFSIKCDSLKLDLSKTGLQKDREMAELWGKFAGRRVRWAGKVYDVRSVGYTGEIEVVVTFPVELKSGSLMVFLEYPSEERSRLASYQVKQEIWFDSAIPRDGRSELERAAGSAIHLPGRIAPK